MTNWKTIYTILLHLVLIGLIYTKFAPPQNLSSSTGCENLEPVPSKEGKNEITESEKKPINSLSSVLVLPHPPNFLQSRKIQFLSYTTTNENGKKKVIFKEWNGTGLVNTKVDSEAIRWE